MRGREKPTALRFMALFLALVAWGFVTVEQRARRPVERFVEAPVSYNRQPGLVLLNPVQTASVQLRGRPEAIRHATPFTVEVQIRIPPAQTGRQSLPIGPDNVLAPEGVEVISVEPSQVTLDVEREVRRFLPIRVRLVGEPAAGAVAGEAQVSPPSAVVVGPESLLRGVTEVDTSPVSLEGHALDFEESAFVVAPDSRLTIVQPSVVSVLIPMGQPLPVSEEE